MRGRGARMMSELTKTRSPWWRCTMAGPSAATSRWAPRGFTPPGGARPQGGAGRGREPMGTEEVHLHGVGEVLRRRGQGAARLGVARARHHDVDGTYRALGGTGEFLHRGGLGQIETVHVRFTARGPDAGRHLLALPDPAGAEHDPMARRGQCRGHGGADPRGGPGHDRSPALGGGGEFRSGHGAILAQCDPARRVPRGVTVVESSANPRTLMEWTRRAPLSSIS